MNSFTDEISLTPVQGSNKLWRVNDEFAWHIGRKGSDYHVIVEAGFVYDLASVPMIARPVVPHTTAPQASALHDKGYRDNEIWIVKEWVDGEPIYLDEPHKMHREFWDVQFLQAMTALEVFPARAQAAYAGVRAGGWYSWKKHRKND